MDVSHEETKVYLKGNIYSGLTPFKNIFGDIDILGAFDEMFLPPSPLPPITIHVHGCPSFPHSSIIPDCIHSRGRSVMHLPF